MRRPITTEPTIREGREPNASVSQVLPGYRVLGGLERQPAQAAR